MTEILFDDIGSFPLPPNASKTELSEAAFNRNNDKLLFPVLDQIFELKMNAGVTIPNYSQVRDMTEQFLRPMRDENCTNGPFSLKEECAEMVEMEALDLYCQKVREQTGEKPLVRMCVTGPTELYLKEFGGASYTDIYQIFAEDVNLFVRNAMNRMKNCKIATVSIDEPSIGINPDLSLPADDIVAALTTAGRDAAKNGADVEIHIHSPLYYELACQAESINVIGMESAATPSYADMIDKTVLSDYDTYVRAGITRTDIFSMVGTLNEKYGGNVWDKPEIMQEIVTVMETPETAEKRLEKLYTVFGDRIKYAGPDCGLGSWPSQELAAALLKNTGIAIAAFNKNHK
ncbi:methionine synthase [Methanimicrococcus blatticola]|uniref:5-methyltetrahydropteroyltriglutamate--homocysteine methyltransferase n=1 Tax=Methanimicrococcus blatticola TaxID=91560 RepID=A0A484F3G2_9EURY|nr:methionine synthase [Methanimicrococcus blatticola]MBZ3935700.1 methionine synthase [Methanimicrococcus blatticola]MCC2508179.1 methionine synthase [Methanimicrococcus blatticola]TDQ68744.1 5-methyltetrahydropteroyltriglutamate--homocysteine methyltransferase [Methanimicrococcus blatticola]